MMPTDLLAARTQMAVSLGFHIIFAEIGVAMPLLMVLAEWRWRRTGDPVYRELAHRWARGIAMSGAASAAFVVLVNAWMNAPVGFRTVADGRLAGIDPIAGMQSPTAFQPARTCCSPRTPPREWRSRAFTHGCC